MTVHLLHRAGEPWTDLKDTLTTQLADGRAVMWMSFSGTIQIFADIDGLITRVRQGPPGSVHPDDGLPLVVQHPWFATSCGIGDASGYRSTPPLLVAAVETAADVEAAADVARAAARELVAAKCDPHAVLDGHPQQPCDALYCPAQNR